MFGNVHKRVSWKNLGNIGTRWKLLKFSETSPPAWEKYWADQRKYWGADRKDKTRVQMYFGKTNTEEKLLKKCRKGYEEYKDYLKHWHGLCKVNEIVEVIDLKPHTIVLSKDWRGEIKDHSDLTLLLFEEKTFYRKHVRFCCKISSYGTVVVPIGSIMTIMGERPGKSRVSHSRGRSKNKIETVIFDKGKNRLQIGDALFSLID